MLCARAIAFYLSRVSFVGAIVRGGILLCLHNSIWIRDRKAFARQLIWCNISYLIAHMIQITFLLQCCCTQCNGGACWHDWLHCEWAVHHSHPVIGCHYLCILQIADFAKLGYFAVYRCMYYSCAQGGCYFCTIAFFSIAQISDFAKVCYFSQVAYYITMQQALRLHWNHQHLIWIKIQIKSFEGSDSIFHRIFQWSQLYLQFKSILASTDTECHSAQKMH